MRILHISTTIPWRGGDAQMLTALYLLKDKKDIANYVLCPSGSVLEVKCKEHSIPYFTSSFRTKFSIIFMKKILKIVKNEKIDCVHVHDSTALTLALLALKFLPKVKLVYSRKRNNRIKKKIKRLKYNNKRIDKIICVSNAVREVLLPFVENHKKIKVIYDGIDVEGFSKCSDHGILKKEFALKPETVIIANIAGLTHQKDLFTFIDAAEIINNLYTNPLHFFIIGEGKLREDLEHYAANKRLDSKITFTGFRNDVKLIFGELDILLMSSESEGLPLTIMEAFAARVPVVSTAAGGVGEAIRNKSTGMISPVGNATALAENVLFILNNQSIKRKIIDNAALTVEKKFTLDKMGKEYYKFYRSLIADFHR